MVSQFGQRTIRSARFSGTLNTCSHRGHETWMGIDYTSHVAKEMINTMITPTRKIAEHIRNISAAEEERVRDSRRSDRDLLTLDRGLGSSPLPFPVCFPTAISGAADADEPLGGCDPGWADGA